MERKIDSAGILFVCGNECLLAHSTNSRRVGSWMPPKGHLENDESPEQAAIRETEEEIGWRVRGAFLKDFFDVLYDDRSGNIYKKVRVYVVRIEDKDPDNNGPLLMKTRDLQREEVDEIRWCTAADVDQLALHRYVSGIKEYL